MHNMSNLEIDGVITAAAVFAGIYSIKYNFKINIRVRKSSSI